MYELPVKSLEDFGGCVRIESDIRDGAAVSCSVSAVQKGKQTGRNENVLEKEETAAD